MIGGRAPLATHEHIYEIAFPERPGALIDFLDSVGDEWNISLFHYRNAASDSGSVLIGFETDTPNELETRLKGTHFEWKRVDAAKSIALFL
jgi:threonine dehydratase